MEKTVLPYEVLFRFGSTGALQGGHIQYITVYVDPDGDPPSPKVGEAMPIAVSGGDGVPLSEIMSRVQVAAVAGANEAEAARAEAVAQVLDLTAENAGLKKQNDKLEGKVNTAETRVTQMGDRIAELEARLGDALNKLASKA